MKKRFYFYFFLNILFIFLFLFLILRRLFFIVKNIYFLVLLYELIILFLLIFSLFKIIKKSNFFFTKWFLNILLFIFSLFIIFFSEPFSIISYILFLYSISIFMVIKNKIKSVLFITYFFFYFLLILLKNFNILKINSALNVLLNITNIEIELIVFLLSISYLFFIVFFIKLKLLGFFKNKNTNKSYQKKVTRYNYLLKQNKRLRQILRNIIFTKHKRKKKDDIINMNSNEFIRSILRKVKIKEEKIVLKDRGINIHIDKKKVGNIAFGLFLLLKKLNVSPIKIFVEEVKDESYNLIIELPYTDELFNILKDEFNKEKILILLIKYYNYNLVINQIEGKIIIKIFITREKIISYNYKTDYKFDISGSKNNGGELRVYNIYIDKTIELTKNEFNLLYLLLKRFLKDKKSNVISSNSEGYLTKKEIEKNIFGNINNYGNRLNQLLTRFRKKLKENEIKDFFEIKNKAIRISTSCKYYDIIIKNYR